MRALWFGQPVEVVGYHTDVDAGVVARFRTASGALKYAPVSALRLPGAADAAHGRGCTGVKQTPVTGGA